MTLNQPWFSVHLNNGVDNSAAALLVITYFVMFIRMPAGCEYHYSDCKTLK